MFVLYPGRLRSRLATSVPLRNPTMTRWQAVVAAVVTVACLGSADEAGATVFRHCRDSIAAGAPAGNPATDWLTGWDWTCGCWGNFGFGVAYAAAGPAAGTPGPTAPGTRPGPTPPAVPP